MNQLDRAARKDPALYAFGTQPLRRLTAEEEVGAPFEDRLISVWGYIVRRSRRFVATLTERERAHLGADDLVDAIVLSLLQKDAKWNPQRGRYITFVERVARNVITFERERARVVRAPSNARERLERYRAMDADGTLKPGPRRTMRAIEAALGETEVVHPQAGPTTSRDETPRAVAAEEAQARAGRDVITALRSVENPLEALILARAWGLFGAEEQTAAQIASSIPGGMDARRVRAIRSQAEESLRGRIEKLRENHP